MARIEKGFSRRSPTESIIRDIAALYNDFDLPEPLPTPSVQINEIDPTDFTNYTLLLGKLESSAFDIDSKIETVHALAENAFLPDEEGNLDEQRVGRFLEQSVKLYQDENTPEELKTELYDVVTPQILDQVAEQSSINRWNADNVEQALHAYVTFQDIERKYHENAPKIYREITQELIYGRAVDESLERVGAITKNEGRGVAIYLGTKGAEMTQTVSKVAYRNTSKEHNAQPIIATYYRDNVLSLNPYDESADPDGDLLTIEESIADLTRREGSPRSKGTELLVRSKINNNGEISLFPATPNVGGHIVAASGFAAQKRLEAVRDNNLTYDGPKRADAFRKLQVDNTGASVLISLGDGAYPELDAALEFQSNLRLPTINLVQHNNVAIGVESNEVLSNTNYSEKGHGRGIPGVSIEKTDFDGMYLAMEFATKRAIRDAGPTIIEARTVRLLPHSNEHGDHLTSEYLQEIEHILQEYAKDLHENDPRRSAIDDLYKRDVVKASQTDNQVKLKSRLLEFAKNDSLDQEIVAKILAIQDRIVDPYETTIESLIQKGFVQKKEVEAWQQEAKANVEEAQEEVMQRAVPKPEYALQNIRLATPSIQDLRNGEYSHERMRVNGSEAVRQALTESMEENPNILAWGTDIYKGLSIDRGTGNTLRHTWQGGYFKQEDGLFPQFGDQPMRVMNTPIAERDVLKFALGMATTPTNEKDLKDALRLFVDFQYADYGIEAWPAWHVLANVLYTTSGQITRPVGVLLPSGAVPGGGTMHSHEVAAKAYQTNTNVDVFYTSDPESTYKLLRYCLLYENNPYILMADKKMFLGGESARQEFEIGTGFIEPGRARTVKEGKGLQILSYGSMVNTIRKSLDLLDDQFKEDIGVLDIMSLRPFPVDDVYNFLDGGKGNVIIAHEEPKAQGFGNQIHSFLTRGDSDFRDLTRNREFYIEGSEDVPNPPCDGILLDEVLPNAQKMRDIILSRLTD